MKSKSLTLVFLLTVVFIVAWNLRGQATEPAPRPSEYEFRVLPLIALVGDSPEARKKIGELMVQSKEGVNRTDLDVTDYQKAFDRLANEGWEPVTVNKSNYWVFRRLKRHG